MTEQLITINGLQYRQQKHMGECGVKNKKQLYFPFFLMGACGVEEAVISWNGEREVLIAPKKMDYKWFALIAEKLKENYQWDYDWESFRKNILEPNREHLKSALKINDEIVDRLLCDGGVFLNHFEDNWDDDEIDEFGDRYFPNFKNLLAGLDMEY